MFFLGGRNQIFKYLDELCAVYMYKTWTAGPRRRRRRRLLKKRKNTKKTYKKCTSVYIANTDKEL
jgi:hypothetical protein